jgi:K+-transporting ATPase KdpF subunit
MSSDRAAKLSRPPAKMQSRVKTIQGTDMATYVLLSLLVLLVMYLFYAVINPERF